MAGEGRSPAVRITLHLAPSEIELRAIHNGLRAYNATYVGDSTTTHFVLLVRDAGGLALGGFEGYLRWGWLHVENLWLPEALRRQGLGSRLLREAESFALARGCTASLLDTFEFQALGFYERHGYAVFGVLEGYPPGSRRYYLRKALQPAPNPGAAERGD